MSPSWRCQTHHSRCLNTRASAIPSFVKHSISRSCCVSSWSCTTSLYFETEELKKWLKFHRQSTWSEREMSSLSNPFDLWKRVGICCSFKKVAPKHGLTFLSSCKINVRHVENKKLAKISLKRKKNVYSFFSASLLFCFEEGFWLITCWIDFVVWCEKRLSCLFG